MKLCLRSIIISILNLPPIYIYIYIGAAFLISLISLITVSGSAFADDLDYSVTVQPSLNVTTSASDIVLRLNPATNPFASENLTVSVGTNNQTGYKLYVSTTNDTTNLVEENDSNLYIETLSSEVSESNFTANRWGYKLNSSSTNYAPFVSGTLVNSSDTATASVSSTLTFGAKADYNTKAGTYNLALNFQATANPLVQYMQDLNPSACVTTEPTLAIDSRDNKEYYIQRLDDGKCWMVTDLNLAGGTKLYSETSDVPAGYPESGGTGYYTLPTSSSTGFSDDTVAYVYNTGLETSDQSDCTSTQACNSYYSWLAATAGGKNSSGTSVTSDGGMTAYSVCPKGWKLPLATTDGVSRDSGGYTGGDFYKMILAVTGQSSLADGYQESTANFYNNAGPGTTPNFLLAGAYYNSQLGGGGSSGYCWSSSSRSGTNAYSLDFYSGGVSSAYNNIRRYGFSVRCVLSES